MVLRIQVLKILAVLFLLLSFQNIAQSKTYTLKFATLIPSGTSWTNTLDEWVKEVEAKSNGRIKFKMYPGGVMGDEPDVLRKIRKGQLHGGLFTGYGIGRIYSPARVLEIPFLFKNTKESDYVRNKIMPDIKKGFKKKGFELLGWPEVGFIHLFSKNRIDSFDAVRKQRIWLWQGDPLGEAFFEASDIDPIPLSIIDVYTQLSAKHGSIDTVYISTFGALALQWYTKVKYGTNIPLTNAIGGLVISNMFFDKLPADLQKVLRSTGLQYSDKMRLNTRADNEKSIDILKDNGIEFLWDWNDEEMKELISIRDKAAKYLVSTDYIPTEDFERVRTLLKDYRSKNSE